MTLTEYVASGYLGKLCVFQLNNGTSVRGIVSNFFPAEPTVFYYVASGNIRDFKAAEERKNIQEMKRLCVSIDLMVIANVMVLESAR